ncbi:anchored repeat ABC transporter, substrate-binding protein [Allorhizocola rhizosphaerae]|uniref:anchored repeat ABC transporter, substrate-binding protein n=1 Tax=Allorhizocola rhizosphaerae TaxID=1872709 RepID=UPI000E3C2A12|nr:anchored repeat ABC transporter, substrate-binding protein [Allorhizocola rhizosphaerae]
MRWRAVTLAMCLAVASTGCTALSNSDSDIRVVASTEIIADLARNVGGDRVVVDSLVPPGADPHSYEPTPADAVKVTKADVVFTNHLLLEPHALIKAIDANAPKGIPNVSLAESAEMYGAHVIPLVEDLGLDVIWLGLAVRGTGGLSRADDVHLRASKLEGPGALVVYLTGALGEPTVYFNSADGLDEKDVAVLPPAAHTHLNWAFTTPGIYQLTLTAQVQGKPAGEGTFTFAVGVDPQTAGKPTILGKGHTDLTVDIDKGQVYAYSDAISGRKQDVIAADQVVIDVPNKALVSVPADARFGFLGTAGKQIHQLPQAVLGKHVHGEIDPHLWQDVRNVKAYVQLIRDTLSKADPAGAQGYAARSRAYLAELDALDAFVRERISAIPSGRRQLITTHDAFGYLAAAYDMTVAGFVVPNPAQEPSVEQVRKLTETIGNLKVPAVFLEPHLAHRGGVLQQVAADRGVRVCKLYGDSFDSQADTYLKMMRHNASELRSCLGEAGGPKLSQLSQASPIVIADGHVDIGPRFVDGKWRIQLRDDTTQPSAWRELRDVVLKAGDKAVIEVPSDDRFAFLGAPGSKVWLFPQVQQPGVLWPGWNTQDPQVAAEVKREMSWTLHGVRGPGKMLLFLNGAFGEPLQVFDSAKPMPQRSTIETNTHAHGNWVFTTQGAYQLDIEMSATLNSGTTVTDRQTLTILAGDGPIPTPTQSPTVAPSSTAAVVAQDSRPAEFPWVAVGAAAVVVVLGVLLLLWRRRR